MNTQIDDGERDTATVRVMTLLNVKERKAAEKIVDAVIAGAIDQAFELMNGSGPVPTTMVTAKADQVRFICNRAGRMLSQREVEVVLRLTSAAARAVVTTMNATYAEGLRTQRLQWMRADVHVSATGSKRDGLTWTLRFTEPSTLETTWNELQRIGIGDQCVRDESGLTVTVPQRIESDGNSIDALQVLGVATPKPGPQR